jgi:hypothetical protein
MGAVIEVKYFNSFLLKKASSSLTGASPVGNKILKYNGSFGIPASLGGYPRTTNLTEENSWVIEEARIRGGYNNTSVDFGVKAYTTTDEPNGFIRGSSLIYSGIFNSRTGINQTNVFSVGENITKSLDPVNGSVQRLYAEDTNLVIFQENKVSRALIDKDAIYSAEGGGSITSSNLVVGQILPYAGEFGISQNPESFAVYGYRKYFTDKDRNAVLRLSKDGLTEISLSGMYDYFRDEFSTINEPGSPGRLTGGWDIYTKQYTLCLQGGVAAASQSFDTLSFDEKVLGWTSFYTYKPDFILSLKNRMYTLKNNSLFAHYATVDGNNVAVPRGRFYGVQSPSSVTFIFNPAPNYSKTFKTINYEGSNGWKVNSFTSDQTGAEDLNGAEAFFVDSTNSIFSYREGEYVINPINGQAVTRANYQSVFYTNEPPYNRLYAGFNLKENKYVTNLVNNTSLSSSEVRGGSSVTGIKGYYTTVIISTDDTTDLGGPKQLFSVGSAYMQNNGY